MSRTPTLTLFVPELLRPPLAEGPLAAAPEPACPELARLLARGRLTRGAEQADEAALAEVFGMVAGASLPFGELRRRGEEAPARGVKDAAGRADAQAGSAWLCADPVHLRLLSDRMVVADRHSLRLEPEESAALVETLNRHLGAGEEAGSDAFAARFVAAGDRWYLRCSGSAGLLAALAKLETPPLSAVAGRSLRHHLPTIPELVPLRRLLLEAQMVLAADPVNAARAERGELPVNALWVWGGGMLAASAAPPPFATVATGSALARGLARHCRTRVLPLPAKAGEWLTMLAADPVGAAADANEQAPALAVDRDAHLVVLESLVVSALLDDDAAWREALEALEKDWFAPLAAALRGGRLAAIELVAPTRLGLLRWQFSPTDRWRLWRRARPLSELARMLATTQA
ncbi:hypothetical protein [Rhodocyclus purpureus]|uniref:hypothetical protein n=1 Tax=Rhodocyclus purpureus TaxID=1067 RepID=UPI001912383E|nr:hypothetical protein [Rhodocyclus purpureus]MBK5914792.1 hypothetical protein [Rhodocyclus purpureus]